jgi:hypothetical protein
VGRIALIAVVLAGLTASPGLAGSAPKWTAKGAITKLNKRAITVDGKSCRITSDSPKPAFHVYFVGSTVKIACADGVLLTIDLLHPLTLPKNGSPGTTGQSVTTSSSSSSSTSVSSSSSSSSSTSSSGSNSASALAIAGDFSVTAVGDGKISVASGKYSFTCTVGTGSPDVSVFKVGSHVSKMTCKDDVLATIAA